jgi:hypothetical protein
MATDVQAFKVKLQAERQAVADEVALIDVDAERARMATAEANLQAAMVPYNKATQRWTLVNEKFDRLTVLDAQIALFTA